MVDADWFRRLRTLEEEVNAEWHKGLEKRAAAQMKEGFSEIPEELESADKQKAELLGPHLDKQFHISPAFYDYAMMLLHETFVQSKEFVTAGVFKPENGQMVMQQIIPYQWLVGTQYVSPFPTQMGPFIIDEHDKVISGKIQSGLRPNKFSILERRFAQDDEYLIPFHTHPATFYPSEGDKKHWLIGVIGFEHSNAELERLFEGSFSSCIEIGKGERWKKIRLNKTISYQLQPYKVDGGLWTRLCNDCHPAIGLFVGSEQGHTNVPLYLNGKPLQSGVTNH